MLSIVIKYKKLRHTYEIFWRQDHSFESFFNCKKIGVLLNAVMHAERSVHYSAVWLQKRLYILIKENNIVGTSHILKQIHWVAICDSREKELANWNDCVIGSEVTGAFIWNLPHTGASTLNPASTQGYRGWGEPRRWPLQAHTMQL